MSKSVVKAADLRRELIRRLSEAGLDGCTVDLPVKAPQSGNIGRNWAVDILGASTGEAYERAKQIIGAAGAEFDCLEFTPKRPKPLG